MTLQEVSEKYKVSESSLKSSFPRTQAAILKKYGVTIKKEGRGASATYIEEVLDDQRALTMYEEQTDILFINSEQLSMINWDFHVFLGIITTPMLVFRGSYVDFLKYIQAPVTETNLEELKTALEKKMFKASCRKILAKIDFTGSDVIISNCKQEVLSTNTLLK